MTSGSSLASAAQPQPSKQPRIHGQISVHVPPPTTAAPAALDPAPTPRTASHEAAGPHPPRAPAHAALHYQRFGDKKRFFKALLSQNAGLLTPHTPTSVLDPDALVMTDLPNDVLLTVILLLPHRELASIALVNKRFRALVKCAKAFHFNFVTPRGGQGHISQFREQPAAAAAGGGAERTGGGLAPGQVEKGQGAFDLEAPDAPRARRAR